MPTDSGGFLNNFLSGLNPGSIAAMLPMYYASQRAGDEMREQAGRYGALGREAASMASPVSNARRGEWDQRLSQLYENPQAFLEGNPEYKAALALGTDELAARNAASGHNLGGKATTDQLRFLTKLGSQYIGKERDDLMNMAGYQFDPARGASMLMEGGRLQGEAEQAALAARLYPLGAMATALNQGGRGGPGGGGPGGGGSIMDLLNRLRGGQDSGRNPAGIQDLLRMFGSNPSSLAGLWRNLPSIPGLREIYGDIQNTDWTQGGQFGPGWSEGFFNAQQPGYGSWWEDGMGDYFESNPDWQHLFDGEFDPSSYFTLDDAWLGG